MAGKRRGRVREPLSGEKILSRGLEYYSEADLARILGTFTPKPEFNRAEFVSRLNTAAFAYVGRLHREPREPPSQAARDWRRLRGQIAAISKRLDGLSVNKRADLEYAAYRLAEAGDSPPGYEMVRVSQQGVDEGLPEEEEHYWPAERALADAQRTLAWLARSIGDAAADAENLKASAGGNRAIEAEHFVFQSAMILLHDYSADPLRAYHDKHNGTVRGNLIDFLEACL